MQALLNAFFPRRCPACRKLAETVWCYQCAPLVEPTGTSICQTCGKWLACGPRQRCLECIRTPPEFDSMRTAFAYGGPVAEAIMAFKHGNRRSSARPFAALVLEQLAPSVLETVDLVAPVPLHPVQLARRGYNQAAILAHHVAIETGLPLLYALERVRDTGGQGGLSARERRANVAGAFTVRDPDMLAQRAILVVDDVITTGATTLECSRVLRHFGAREVHICAVARPFD
jgi:ComF family protein